ncbi:MAG: NTP transferase domain-containing protein [Thermoleophilia bacterium]|nr:NTP transferase domain-containing protein [Thermoleophilia bacterium]
MRAESDDPGAPALHCAILAGGSGSRIGGAKALRRLAGRPMAAYPIAAAEAAGLRAILVAKPGTDLAELESAGTEVLREPERPQHPLVGVIAALRAIDAPLVVCPCDLPLVPAGLLAHLAQLDRPALAAPTPAAVEPLLGRYEPAAVGSLEAGVARRASAREIAAGLDPLYVEDAVLRTFGDVPTMLANVNTEEDLARLELLLASP